MFGIIFNKPIKDFKPVKKFGSKESALAFLEDANDFNDLLMWGIHNRDLITINQYLPFYATYIEDREYFIKRMKILNNFFSKSEAMQEIKVQYLLSVFYLITFFDASPITDEAIGRGLNNTIIRSINSLSADSKGSLKMLIEEMNKNKKKV